MLTINDLQLKFTRINDSLAKESLNDEERALLENDKTKVLSDFKQHLKGLANIQKKKKAHHEAPSSSLFYWIKVGVLGLVSLIGLAQGSIGGYLGANTLFSQLISSIHSAWLTVIAVAVTAINVILFTAFEIDMLKSLLGISNQSAAGKMIAEHEKQIELATKINAQIESACVVSQSNFQEYKAMVDLSNAINSDIDIKKKTYREYVEHPIKAGIRWFLTGCGAIMTCLSSYWAGIALLTGLSASLVGTPAGWAIISILTATSLILYFAMEGSSIRNMLNPTLGAFDRVKEKLNNFACKQDFENQSLLLNRSLIAAAPAKHKLINTLDLAVNTDYKRKKYNAGFFAHQTSYTDALLDYPFASKVPRM